MSGRFVTIQLFAGPHPKSTSCADDGAWERLPHLSWFSKGEHLRPRHHIQTATYKPSDSTLSVRRSKIKIFDLTDIKKDGSNCRGGENTTGRNMNPPGCVRPVRRFPPVVWRV